MKDSKAQDLKAWLSLGEASREMGVSPATLRMWADAGRVQSYRTPGGHRRFKPSFGEAPVSGGRRTETRWRLLEHSALGRVRLKLESGNDPRVLGWFPADARDKHREAGRAVVKLLVLALQKGQADLDARADALGRAYGELMAQYMIPVREAMTALGFFRGAFVESVIEFAFGVGETTPEQLSEWLGRVNHILDRVSVAMIEFPAGAAFEGVKE